MLFADLRREKLAAIAAIEEQIAALQDALSQEQAHLQAIGSVEQSAESALTQVANAIRGIRAICPTELALFKAQLLALFDDRDPLPPGDNPPDHPDDPIDDAPDKTNTIGHTPDTPTTPIDVPASPPRKRGRKPKAPPLAA